MRRDTEKNVMVRGTETGNLGTSEVNSFFVDVSTRSVLTMEGTDVRDLLHRISTNDLSKLQPSQSIETILTNEKGRIIDIISVVNKGEGRFLLAGLTDGSDNLARWLEKYIIMEDAKIAKPGLCHFLGQGRSPEGLVQTENQTVFSERWGDNHFFHVVVDSKDGDSARRGLLEKGLKEIGREEYEEFRIQNAIPAFPNEFSLDINPLEAGLRHLISWTKGCYIGQEVIARLDTYKKVQRKLVQLECGAFSGVLPAPLTDGHEEVGHLTSLSTQGIGLGYVKASLLPEIVLFLKGFESHEIRIVSP